jgi:F0F1-type ATP synthase assembly protein I
VTRTAHRLGVIVLALTTVAWTSSGAEPLMAGLAGARAPIDFVRSFIAAAALARGDRRYAVDAERRNAEAAQVGAPTVPIHEGPYLPHPPPAALLVVPLVPLGFQAASLVWLGISVGCAAWLAWVLAQIWGAVSVARATGFFVLLLLWPPVLHNIEKGQWSLLLAALMAAGWRDLSGGRQQRGGVWFGLAASLKIIPAVLLPLLAMRARPAARTMMLTVVGVVLATLPAVGLTGWTLFVGASEGNVRALETWIANTASMHGLFARLFVGGPFARPLLLAPPLGYALTIVASAALLAVATAVAYRTRHNDETDDALFSMWTSLAVLLNPLAWGHSVILLLVPMALLAKHARQNDEGGLIVGLGVALALLSVPKETLHLLGGPLPLSPGRGLLMSLHAMGALMVFAAGAVLATRGRWRFKRRSL